MRTVNVATWINFRWMLIESFIPNSPHRMQFTTSTSSYICKLIIFYFLRFLLTVKKPLISKFKFSFRAAFSLKQWGAVVEVLAHHIFFDHTLNSCHQYCKEKCDYSWITLDGLKTEVFYLWQAEGQAMSEKSYYQDRS